MTEPYSCDADDDTAMGAAEGLFTAVVAEGEGAGSAAGQAPSAQVSSSAPGRGRFCRGCISCITAIETLNNNKPSTMAMGRGSLLTPPSG